MSVFLSELALSPGVREASVWKYLIQAVSNILYKQLIKFLCSFYHFIKLFLKTSHATRNELWQDSEEQDVVSGDQSDKSETLHYLKVLLALSLSLF